MQSYRKLQTGSRAPSSSMRARALRVRRRRRI